jgi:hypothetical protein
MYRTWTIAFLLTTLAVAGQDRKTHKDYVPDKKTAERIGEAVLIGQ